MTKAAELAKMGEVITNGQIGGRRNALVNGQMQCWQRGTAFSSIANSLTYTADRWVAFVAAGSAQAQVNQDTSVPEGFRYSLEFGRANGETDEVFQYVCQLLETQDSLQFANKKVTFSFYAKAGANFSAASNNINVKVSSGTGTDESSATFSAGPATGFTGNAAIVNATQAITTTWTRYTFTGTVSASATQIAVAIGYDPVGTAGADDNFYITGCQLEEGSQATPFEHRSFGEERQLCYRYYYQMKAATSFMKIGHGRAYSTTDTTATYPVPVPMRANPTGSVSAASDVGTAGLSAGGTTSANPAAETMDDYSRFAINVTRSGGGYSAGTIYQIESDNNTNMTIKLDAEL